MKRWFRPTNVVLALLCVMYCITYLDRVNVGTAAAGFGAEFALSKTQVGFVFSAFAYPYLVFQIIGGWVSDRFGARRTLVVCGLLWSGATALTGMAAGFLSMVAARVLLGLGEGATFPAATSAMSRWVARDRRGFAQGITHAAARLGNSAAPTLVVAVMATQGWRASFYVCAAISFVWVVVWAWSFTENPRAHPRITPAELESLPTPKAKSSDIPWGALVRRMAPVTVVYFCYGWTLWLFLSWLPQYFLHSHGLVLSNSAYSASTVFLVGALGNTCGGILTDRILRKTASLRRARSVMVATCMALTVVCQLPLVLAHDLVLALISLSASFFFAEMTIGPMWAVPMDIAPEFAGTASGIMNTGSALAAMLSPVMAGFLIDRFRNWELPFVGSIVLMALGAVLALRMHPEAKFTGGGS